MRLRSAPLAGLLLLLASLGAAQGCPLRSGGGSIGRPFLGVLLAQQAAEADANTVAAAGVSLAPQTSPVAGAQTRTVWAVPAPVSQAASLHAVTGSAL